MDDEVEVNLEAELDKAATPDSETVADHGEEKQDEDEKKFSQAELDKIIQKRIAKAEAVAERRALKVYAEKLEGMTRQPVNQEPVDTKPKLADYNNVEDYVEAVSDWKLNQRDADGRKSAEVQQQEATASKVQKIFDQAEKIEGFDREAFDELPVSEAMAWTIMDSDVAAKLVVHLTNNPTETKRIAALTPARQAAEIGKLEDKILTAKVKVSGAPDPIKPIGGKSGSTSGDLAKASMEDYIAARAKQGARWAR